MKPWHHPCREKNPWYDPFAAAVLAAKVCDFRGLEDDVLQTFHVGLGKQKMEEPKQMDENGWTLMKIHTNATS